MRNAYSILVGKSEGKRSFRRSNRRWQSKIKMDVRKEHGKARTGFI
jgi:hypothetical protein